jgi:DNA-binding CsgD family transcriptional regulator/tetratricopeptide (TPR) repeat protein
MEPPLERGYSGTPRYTMLDTIREYGLEQLQERDELGSVQRRHGEWCLQVAEQAAAAVGSAAQETWIRPLEVEHDNVRAALTWSLAVAPDIALRLVGALWRFWYAQGYLGEGSRWLEAALARDDGSHPDARARALLGAGALARELGDRGHAGPALEESLRLFRSLDDQRGTSTALNFLGLVARDESDLARAVTFHQEALALARAANDPWRITFSLNHLGIALLRQRLDESAAAVLAESLTMARGRGDRWTAGVALANLGQLAMNQGELDRAVVALHESLELFRQLGVRRGAAQTLAQLGAVTRRLGDRARAISLLEESRVLLRDLGDGGGLAIVLLELGLAHLQQGDPDRAFAQCGEGLALAVERGDHLQVAIALERLGAIAASRDQPSTAIRLFAAADQMRTEFGVPLSPDELRELGPAVGSLVMDRQSPKHQRAWDAGRQLALNDAVALALSPEPPASVIAESADKPPPPRMRGKFGRLTPREEDVLRLLVEGRTDREIADALFIGHRTVASHVMSILGKLGVDSRTAAATYAVRHGLV